MSVRPIVRMLAEVRELTDAEIGAVVGGSDMETDKTVCADGTITRDHGSPSSPPDEGQTLDSQ